MPKPINRGLHGLMDYGFFGMFARLLRMLGLPKPIIRVFTAMGATQTALNALTDQPYALRPVVPFEVHGVIEKFSGPLYVLLPLAAGARKDRRSRDFQLIVGAVLVIAYNLTDWDDRNSSTKKRRKAV